MFAAPAAGFSDTESGFLNQRDNHLIMFNTFRESRRDMPLIFFNYKFYT